MNIKQSIVAWVIGVVFTSFYAYAVFMIPIPLEAFKFMAIRTTPVLIVGFGLIYILKDKV
jgi:hypothetical protein